MASIHTVLRCVITLILLSFVSLLLLLLLLLFRLYHNGTMSYTIYQWLSQILNFASMIISKLSQNRVYKTQIAIAWNETGSWARLPFHFQNE